MEVSGVLFKVLDRDKEPKSFQEMLAKSTKHCFEGLSIKRKRITVSITPVSAYVNVIYFLRFRRFRT